MIFPRLHVSPLRYDGSPKFSYPVDGLELGPRRWVVHGIFGPEVAPHSARLGFYPGDHTIEFFSADAWWNVNAVFAPTGTARGYYCNVATPSRHEAGQIIYTDLDLDLLVGPDGDCRVLDQEEYEARATRHGYSADLRARVAAALADLIATARAGAPPFDGREARALLARVLAPCADEKADS